MSSIQLTKKPQKKITDFRLWTQSKNLKGHDIIYKANQKQRLIKHYSNILNGEDYNFSGKNPNRTKQKSNIPNLIPTDIQISGKCRSMLNLIYHKINLMKEGTQQVAEYNSMFLKQQSENYFKSQHSNNEQPHFPNIQSNDNKEQTKLNTKKNLTNFIYINDNYRKQLNKAFNTFNPHAHLLNLNMLKKENIEVKQNLEELNDQIENELKEITGKDFYRKKYEKIKQMFERDKIQIPKSQQNQNINEGNTILPTNTRINTGSRMNRTASTGFRSLSNTRNNFTKKQLEHLNLKKKQHEHKEKERKYILIYNIYSLIVELMKDALDKVSDTLEVEPIQHYISDYKKYKDDNIQVQEKKYFPGFGHIEKALKQIASSKMKKENEKTTEDITYNAEYENALLLKQLEISKGKLMSEI